MEDSLTTDGNEESSRDSDDALDAFLNRGMKMKKKNKNESNNSNNKDDEKTKQALVEKEEDRSWISEIANLEDSYRETVRNLVNLKRYISRAVVGELII